MSSFMANVGGVSSATYILITVIQIKVYGFRRWVRLGAGTGMLKREVLREEHKLEDELS